MAATPGTSNHGLGLAIDFAEERDGRPPVESVSDRFVRWLIKNAATYGFSAELQSEPWHWRYVAGDQIPRAVLDFELQQDSRPKVEP
jgi:LAS superfamily LD-carboxypeptidase LdcB